MSAIISPCGKYRYRLERECGMPFEGSKVFAFFGVNPSTADATIDDATVRKWRGFTLRNGGHRFIVGNVFAFRATDVGALFHADDAVGPDNLHHLKQIIADADVLVPCWGSSDKVLKSLRGRLKTLLYILQSSGKPVMHFGLTKGGEPRHPLMLGYDTPLTPWSAQGGSADE
ncbi:hypothetical protein A6723_019470 [Pseudomonas sp. AU11447]|uniref:DUF1643 domain-containing protein n=1 Tax=unclassified Pseudomonas TaxID=196821 RepID=UPI0006D4429D|nr:MULTISPECIES: DUF1643 domain-containing protein [unclassified Pseudomonas]OBY90492.1 hypothetical protein A6723_019470 [Pseudomonas sp. AU11447]